MTVCLQSVLVGIVLLLSVEQVMREDREMLLNLSCWKQLLM